MNMVRIRPFREEDRDLLSKVAAQDDHVVIAPGHVVEKDHRMIGYLGVVPSVLVWMDTHEARVRDSAMVLNFFENMLANNGAGVISVPCNEKSPYLPYLDRLGYADVGSFRMFMKNLNP